MAVGGVESNWRWINKKWWNVDDVLGAGMSGWGEISDLLVRSPRPCLDSPSHSQLVGFRLLFFLAAGSAAQRCARWSESLKLAPQRETPPSEGEKKNLKKKKLKAKWKMAFLPAEGSNTRGLNFRVASQQETLSLSLAHFLYLSPRGHPGFLKSSDQYPRPSYCPTLNFWWRYQEIPTNTKRCHRQMNNL